MVLNENVKLVIISTIFVALMNIEIVENSLKSNLLNKKKRQLFIHENLNIPQISNNTIEEDGIIHIEINERNPKLSQIKKFEQALKNIFAMNGIKYIFKRNFYWRTWREVKNNNGNTSLICYRCKNTVNITCTNCNFCGYWEIEEDPPCPFEIFFIKNRTNICVAKYNQVMNSNVECPTIITFKDLVKCGNPLKSRWRVSRRYDATTKNVSERFVTIICEGRENCEFSTVYSIFPDRVTFRVINTLNHIIYAKIMKFHNKNYACISNCGVLPKQTTSQEQIRKPLSTVDDSSGNGSNHYKYMKKNTTKNMLTMFNFNMNNYWNIKDKRLQVSQHNASVADDRMHCKHLQNHNSEQEYEESEYNDY